MGQAPGAEAGLTRCLEGPGFKSCSQTSVMPTAKGWGHREALQAEPSRGHCSCRTEQGARAETEARLPGVCRPEVGAGVGRPHPLLRLGTLLPPSWRSLTPVCLSETTVSLLWLLNSSGSLLGEHPPEAELRLKGKQIKAEKNSTTRLKLKMNLLPRSWCISIKNRGNMFLDITPTQILVGQKPC